MRSTSLLIAGGSFALQAQAWQPAQADSQHILGQQHAFWSADTKQDDIDIVTGSQFHGLKTFANLPYLNAFSDEEAKGSRYDIVRQYEARSSAGLSTGHVPFLTFHSLTRTKGYSRCPLRHGDLGTARRTLWPKRNQSGQPAYVSRGDFDIHRRGHNESMGKDRRRRGRRADVVRQYHRAEAAGQGAQGVY